MDEKDKRIENLKNALHTLLMLFGEVKKDYEQVIARRNDLIENYEDLRIRHRNLKKMYLNK